MKANTFLFTIFLLITAAFSTSYAQDNTQVGLPEGAIARLGKGGINIMRFSPDGTHLAVGTDVGVWLYDVPDGNETAYFTERPGQVNALTFSADGKILASGGFANPVIQLWDMETGEKLSTLNLLHIIGEKSFVTGLSFFSNDKKLIILERKGKIAHWDIDNNAVEILPHSIEARNAIFVSEKDHIIAVEDQKRNIRFLDAITGETWLNQTEHVFLKDQGRNDIRVFAYSSNGKFLATGSIGNDVMLWDIDKRELSATLKGNSAKFSALAISQDNKTLVGGDANSNIKLWDIETHNELLDLSGHTSGISALVFSPDGKTLASGSNDGTIRFWDYYNGKEISTFAKGHTKWVKKIAFTEDDSILKSVDFNGNMIEWSLRTHLPLKTLSFGQSGARDSVAFSQDAKFFAMQENRWGFAFNPFGPGGQGSLIGGLKAPKFNIELWDLTNDKKIDTPWMDNIGIVDAFLFSTDKKIIIACLDQKGIFSWNINTGDELFQYGYTKPHKKIKLVFSPDEKLLVTSGLGIKPQVWDFASQQEIVLPELKVAVSVAFSPDGTLMAMAQPKSILLWHVTADGLEEGIIHENFTVREDLIFSPDGRTLIFSTINNDNFQNYIQLIDVETGAEIGLLPAHTEIITALVFSHDGKTLASASWDGTILLWDWDNIMDNVNTR